MNKIKSILFKCFLLGIFFVGTIACNDYLNEDNRSAITQENYFQNANQAQTAVNGVYSGLNVFLTRVNYGESPFISIELPVGHAKTLGQNANNNNMIQQRSASIEGVFFTVWSGFYKAIANANMCITNLPTVDMDSAEKSKLLGEVLFLRAFYYYYLVRLYGDIPCITEVISTNSPDFYPKRSSVADIYDKIIIPDLLEAEKTSLPDYDASGRVCKGMVKSLLASVYLTTAGHPLNRSANYELARDKAFEVISGVPNQYPYTLFDNYAYLHDREHKIQQELILQVQVEIGTNDQGTSGIAQLIIPEKCGISKFPDEYGALTVRDEFVKSYEKGDRRANLTLGEKNTFFFNTYEKDGTPISFSPIGLYKYWLEEAAGNNGDQKSDENYTLLRYPEVLLIYAEASNEVSGPSQAAVEQIKKIRDRAGLSTPDAGTFTKDSFREFIWKERYHELAFENKAYFDILRTWKAYDLKNNRFVDAFTFQNESGVTFKKQYLNWPIPSIEINTNPNLNPQNEGWS